MSQHPGHNVRKEMKAMLTRNKEQKEKKSRVKSNNRKRETVENLTITEQKRIKAGGGASGGVLGDRARGDKGSMLNQ